MSHNQNPKKNHHIVSEFILKQFKNHKNIVNEEIYSIGSRFILDENGPIGNETCYRINKKKFSDSNEFNVLKSNVRNLDNKDFCEDFLYSLDHEAYNIFLEKNGIVNDKSVIKTIDLLEDSHSTIETSFSVFLQKFNKDINLNLKKYESSIIKFIESNELRPKIFFEKNVTSPLNFSLEKDFYSVLEKANFFKFFLNFEIMEKIDLYEAIEITKYLQDSKIVEMNKNVKNLLSIVNNTQKSNKTLNNVIFLKNNTNIDFILSDNISSVYYDNFQHFQEIIDISGLNSNVKKINITVISPKIAIILLDTISNKSIININNVSIIKKYNSLFYANSNEWMVLKSINIKRDDIIDQNFYELIKNSKRYSNAFNWLKKGFEGKSESNPDFGYKKISKEFYNSYLKDIVNICSHSCVVIDKYMFLLSNDKMYFEYDGSSKINLTNRVTNFYFNTSNEITVTITDEILIKSLNHFLQYYDLEVLKDVLKSMYSLKDLIIQKKEIILKY